MSKPKRCAANVPSAVADRPASQCLYKATVTVGASSFCKRHAERWERVLGVKAKPMMVTEPGEK